MAPFPGDSSKHQFGTSMPQGGHPPHHSITSSAMESAGRNGQAERFGSLKIEDELELGRLHHRKVARTGASKNLPSIDTSLMIDAWQISGIAHQPSGGHEFGRNRPLIRAIPAPCRADQAPKLCQLADLRGRLLVSHTDGHIPSKWLNIGISLAIDSFLMRSG
jgi:hypothetical protein